MMITLSYAFEKENLSNDEASKEKFPMAQIVESHSDASNESVGTLAADHSQAATNLKLEWNATLAYLVNFIF